MYNLWSWDDAANASFRQAAVYILLIYSGLSWRWTDIHTHVHIYENCRVIGCPHLYVFVGGAWTTQRKPSLGGHANSKPKACPFDAHDKIYPAVIIFLNNKSSVFHFHKNKKWNKNDPDPDQDKADTED